MANFVVLFWQLGSPYVFWMVGVRLSFVVAHRLLHSLILFKRN